MKAFPFTVALFAFTVAAVVAWTQQAPHERPSSIRILPAEHSAIRYYKTAPSNRVSRLADQLQRSRTSLAYDPDHGYLPALLQALDIPPSSQALVFSKTSFQAARISPRLPRAIYHNEDTYVGFVRGGEVIELAVMDLQLGTAFYSLDQAETRRPALRQRGDECLQCHHGGVTAGVPGVLVRSVTPDRGGTPVFPGAAFITDHRSPLRERWGGWYATGTHGASRHLGNVFIEKGEPADRLDPERGANVKTLQSLFDAGAYLTPFSDIPSLLVLEHQTRMANLLARAAWTFRIDGAINASQIEELVGYLLFAGEARLDHPIEGMSDFAATFSARGNRDRTGRSLWQLDLSRRLMKYPCSYLIYTEAFDGLPRPVKDAIYRRLGDALSGRNQDAAHLTAADRLAIHEILTETKPGFPAL